MDNQYLVVLENRTGNAATIYPEVHYVFSDDGFAPEVDIVEQKPGDISVLVDLDESGHEIQGCQSISPGWQATDVSLITQALETKNTDANHNSQLLRITGTQATSNQDIISFEGDFDYQIRKGISLISQLRTRNDEIAKAIASYGNHNP